MTPTPPLLAAITFAFALALPLEGNCRQANFTDVELDQVLEAIADAEGVGIPESERLDLRISLQARLASDYSLRSHQVSLAAHQVFKHYPLIQVAAPAGALVINGDYVERVSSDTYVGRNGDNTVRFNGRNCDPGAFRMHHGERRFVQC